MDLRRRVLFNLIGEDDMRVLGAGSLSTNSSNTFSAAASGKNVLTIVNFSGNSSSAYFLQGFCLGSGTIRAYSNSATMELATVSVSESTIKAKYYISYLILEVD